MKKVFGNFNKTIVVAEAGINHDGNFNQAKKLIEEAARIGADAIKFQYFSAIQLIQPHALAKELKLKGLEWFGNLKKYDFPDSWLAPLMKKARECNIILFLTPLFLEAVHAMEIEDVPWYKIASGDANFTPLIHRVAKTGKPVILSCGLTTEEELQDALSIFKVHHNDVVLLYCISKYPTDIEMIDLNGMIKLAEKFQIPVGFSDHTPSVIAPCLAVSKGACLIEKHFTLDRNIPGADHAISLNPDEFTLMIQYIRETEKICGIRPKKAIEETQQTWMRERNLARRGLFSLQEIKNGEQIHMQNSIFLRPSWGMIPFQIKDNYQFKSKVDFKSQEPINLKDLDNP